MVNGDMHRERGGYGQGGEQPARAPLVPHDGQYPDAHHAGHQLEQLSISTTQGPKASLCSCLLHLDCTNAQSHVSLGVTGLPVLYGSSLFLVQTHPKP